MIPLRSEVQGRVASVRVVCVDDHAFVLEGLRARLSAEPDIDVVAVYASADELLAAPRDADFDVLLIDIDMPGADAFDAIETLRRLRPAARTVVLSAHIRETYVDAAVHAGVRGYLSKREAPAVIVAAVRDVARGELRFCREVLERYGLQPGQEREIVERRRSGKVAHLTPRELQVLRLIGRGMQRNDIARMIHRSPKTIDVHRGRIMDKLGIHDRVELVRFCIREGIVSP